MELAVQKELTKRQIRERAAAALEAAQKQNTTAADNRNYYRKLAGWPPLKTDTKGAN
jgi:uncharacterized protein YkwD